MIRRPPRSTHCISSAASDVYKRQVRRLREERDCLKNFRARVTEAALLEAAELDTVEREVAELIDRAVMTARAAAPPDDAVLLTDVYVSY